MLGYTINIKKDDGLFHRLAYLRYGSLHRTVGNAYISDGTSRKAKYGIIQNVEVRNSN